MAGKKKVPATVFQPPVVTPQWMINGQRISQEKAKQKIATLEYRIIRFLNGKAE